jgi:hypothetical protein
MFDFRVKRTTGHFRAWVHTTTGPRDPASMRVGSLGSPGAPRCSSPPLPGRMTGAASGTRHALRRCGDAWADGGKSTSSQPEEHVIPAWSRPVSDRGHSRSRSTVLLVASPRVRRRSLAAPCSPSPTTSGTPLEPRTGSARTLPRRPHAFPVLSAQTSCCPAHLGARPRGSRSRTQRSAVGDHRRRSRNVGRPHALSSPALYRQTPFAAPASAVTRLSPPAPPPARVPWSTDAPHA